MEKITLVLYLLVKQASSTMVCTESQRSHGLFIFNAIRLDYTALFGLAILISIACYNYLYQPGNGSERTQINPSLKECNPLDGSRNKGEVLEIPEQPSPGHALFKKTGVEVIAANYKTTGQHVPCDLMLQALSTSESNLLEENELVLGPTIKLFSSTKLTRSLEVRIPHGANTILSGRQKWKVILKEYLDKEWKTVSQSETQGIKSFVLKSNHVRFSTDHLSTFAIVGKYDKSSLSVFKRMKIAAFCNATTVGKALKMRLYCFDDCEWSFERLMRKEQKEGGKMVSSIESLNFSVSSEEDVVVTVQEVAGWQLEKEFPLKLSHESLKNSFTDIPRTDLVFRPFPKTRNVGFFVVLVLTQQSTSKTVMYASVPIEKAPASSMT